ncbi:TetR/AcrR family transcriptional regulator [Streptomyces sp. NPDC058171]
MCVRWEVRVSKTGRGGGRAADATRTMRLLWREPGAERSGRGPKQGLSVDEVVSSAVALADADGIEAVTMRRVAERLGVTPMSLYTYVPGKAELLTLMLDWAYLRMPRTDPGPGAPWRERVTAVADDNRALFLRHPWIAEQATVRPVLGPGVLGKYEHELRAFEGTGLGDVETDCALSHLLGFVESVARGSLQSRSIPRDTGQSDDEWWAAHAPLLEEVLDPERFPLASRVGSAAAHAYRGVYSAEHAYAFGLRCVLDGFAALVETGPEPALP